VEKYTDINGMSIYGPAMNMAIAYAAIAAGTFLTSIFALRKLAWPDAAAHRILVATAIALAWPLALPALSFGSAGIVHLIGQRRERVPTEAPAAVSPAA
jgi:hypothetical protein